MVSGKKEFTKIKTLGTLVSSDRKYQINCRFFNMGANEEFTSEEVKQLARSYDFSLTSYQASNLWFNSGNNPAILGKLLEAANAEQQM